MGTLSTAFKSLLAKRQPPYSWHERWNNTNLVVGVLGAEEFLGPVGHFGDLTVENTFTGPAAFIGPDPPPNPKIGQLWWRDDPDGVLYVYYNDGSSTQWVPCTPLPLAEPGTGTVIWVDDAALSAVYPVTPMRSIRLDSGSDGLWFKHSNWPTVQRQTGISADDTTLRLWAGDSGIYFFTKNQSAILGQVWNTGRWTIGADPINPLDVATKQYCDANAGGGTYYLLAGALAGAPTASLSIGLYVVALAFTLPIGLTGSQARAKVAATAQADLTILVNGVSKGTIRFAAAGTVATYVFASAVSIAIGDLVEITAPATPDATLADLTWTLRGQL